MKQNRREFLHSAMATGLSAGMLGASQLPRSQGAPTAQQQNKTVQFVEKKGPVATITMGAAPAPPAGDKSRATASSQTALADALADLRADDEVRVIVLTGPGNGVFVANPRTRYLTMTHRDMVSEWHTFTGIIRAHESITQSEKIVVARVNGDAIGFGSSLLFASDIIVAQEDALIADFHLGMGEVKDYGPPFGIVPGDGGCALVPLYMTPPMAKEYLLLARQYTAAQLAKRGIINYAVPANQLDATVNDIVARLLKRPAYALAWAKRVANAHVIHHLNKTLNAGAGYEMLTFLQLEHATGWKDKKTFR